MTTVVGNGPIIQGLAASAAFEDFMNQIVAERLTNAFADALVEMWQGDEPPKENSEDANAIKRTIRFIFLEKEADRIISEGQSRSFDLLQASGIW